MDRAEASRNILIGTAVLMAILTLQKFIAVLAPPFLLLPILYGIGIWLLLKKDGRGAVILILVLHFILAVVFLVHLSNKGFEPDNYEVMNDFAMVMIGTPIALVGIYGAIRYLRSGRGIDTVRTET